MLMEFDWFLFILTILLAIFGIIMIYSATRTTQSNTNVIVQSAAFALGTGAMLFMCLTLYVSKKNPPDIRAHR